MSDFAEARREYQEKLAAALEGNLDAALGLPTLAERMYQSDGPPLSYADLKAALTELGPPPPPLRIIVGHPMAEAHPGTVGLMLEGNQAHVCLLNRVAHRQLLELFPPEERAAPAMLTGIYGVRVERYDAELHDELVARALREATARVVAAMMTHPFE